jgi:hypothetical protein
MPQDFTSQELSAGGGNFGTGFTSGTVCSRTGSYKAENAYMQAIVVVVAGAKFPNFTDGKKCTWYALSASTNTSTSTDGFDSMKVAAGTV